MTNIYIYIALCLSLTLTSAEPAYSDTTINVGIYRNEPLMVIEPDKAPGGVLIDILEHIAKKESWHIRYVENAWFETLEKGTVDILLGVGYSEDRAKKYNFNNEFFITNWGQVYTHDNSNIHSIMDLSGKKTAVSRGDIYYIFFKTVLDKFDIHPHYFEVNTYNEILELLDRQEVEAGLLPRLYGRYHEDSHTIIKSAINFKPTKIHVVALKGENQALLSTIDHHVSALKQNRNSIYYRSQGYWIEGVRKVSFPRWLRPIWVFLGVAALILMFFIGNVTLSRIVRRKTEQLKKSIAEQERIVSELKIAHDIQMEMIPAQFPEVPYKNGYDLFALLQPAKEVGGDFYDFFLINKHELCIVIGDVSGKGVPAALFMAMAKTCIKTTAKVLHSPQNTITSVNNELSRDNDSCTFVTVFMAIINLESGVMRYTNAGHNQPLIVQAKGVPCFISGAECPAIGFDEDSLFSESTHKLQPGDTICLYTDGVVETISPGNVSYSEEHLVNTLNRCRKHSPKHAAEEILRDVNSFSGNTQPFDDITVLMLKFSGQDKRG